MKNRRNCKDCKKKVPRFGVNRGTVIRNHQKMAVQLRIIVPSLYPLNEAHVLANCRIKFSVPALGDFIEINLTFDSDEAMKESFTIGDNFKVLWEGAFCPFCSSPI